MRYFFLFAGLLLPQLLKAQFGSFDAGSYVLSAAPTVRHEGRLKLLGAYELATKDTDGKKITFVPAQISSFRIGSKKYVTVGGFQAKLGPVGGNTVSQGFAEQLDSGRVVLMRFEYVVYGPSRVSATGTISNGSAFPYVLYLLRRSSEEQIVSLPATGITGGGEKFREALLPYLSTRADLVKLVNEHRVTTHNLAAVIRAFNTDQPFVIAPIIIR